MINPGVEGGKIAKAPIDILSEIKPDNSVKTAKAVQKPFGKNPEKNIDDSNFSSVLDKAIDKGQPKLQEQKNMQASVPNKLSADRVSLPEVANQDEKQPNPVRKFMDSVEGEFGIDANEILAAMAKLDAGELAASPEASAKKVIGELGLDPADEQKVLMMYMDMLKQWQQQAPQNQNVAMLAVGTAALATQVASNSEARNVLGNDMGAANMAKVKDARIPVSELPAASVLSPEKSLLSDPLQKPIEQKPEVMQAADEAEILSQDKPQLIPVAKDKMVASGKEAKSDIISEKPVTKMDELKQKMKGQVADAKSVEKMGSKNDQMQAKIENVETQSQIEDVPKAMAMNDEPTKLNATNEVEPKAEKAEAQKAPAHAVAGAGSTHASNAQSQDSMQKQEGGQKQNAKEEMSAKSIEKSDSVDVFNAKDISSIQQSNYMNVNNDVDTASLAGGAAVGASATRDGQEASVQDLVQSAHVLVKKGGGEMKIQMSPDHMGQLELKVALKDGKVDVQMLTDNADTKKALESQLHELKSGLADLKLDAGSIKVDVAHDSKLDLSNQNQEQQREQARAFLNDFRQNNFSRRNEFLDMTAGAKAYAQKESAPTFAPQVKSNAYRQANSSGRLNLVA